MAPAAKANYKSYEAQARLVRAIVAAHPEVKWNYKGKIGNHFPFSSSSSIAVISSYPSLSCFYVARSCCP
jgi:hypothetical protein